jgi:dolichyl-phosphate-mannose-protein mannosyltransferase
LFENVSFRFDEMHYGKYVAQYLKRTFFFDANPPLGKLLIASVAYLANFDGRFSIVILSFDKVTK